jgi:hypothetical protein
MWFFSRIRLTPLVLFITGQMMFLIPFLFYRHPIWQYTSYDLSLKFMWIHLVGIIAFATGVLVSRVTLSNKLPLVRNLNQQIDQIQIYFILIILAIIIQIANYGGIPLFDFLLGFVNIDQINNMGGRIPGALGAALILELLALLFLAVYKFKKKSNRLIAYLLFIFSVIISVKRQLLFFFLFTVFVYQGRGYIQKRMVLTALLLIIIFLSLGSLRTGQNMIDPLITYLSFPIINEVNLLSDKDLFTFGVVEFFNIFSISWPDIFRESSVSDKSVLTFPSAGLGAIGILVERGGLVGMVIYLSILGFVCQKIWKFAQHSWFYMAIYSFSTWPIFATTTYLHFNNFMFYIAPIFLFFVFYWGCLKTNVPSVNSSIKPLL